MSTTIWQLCEPIVDNGIKNTNFFNGRLLAAEDLQVEQQAQRQREAFLGQALGPGVLQGLEVSLGSLEDGITATLIVQAGMAISAGGQVLSLPRAVPVSVRQQPVSTTTGSPIFNTCKTQQFVPTNVGIYLLVLSPASDYRGSAPYSGLGQGGQISGCGKRFEMEGVQFRMVKVTLDESLGVEAADAAAIKALINATSSVPTGDAASVSLLRSRLALLCLGGGAAAGFAADPSRQQILDEQITSAYETYGLLDRMMAEPSKPVSEDDVPLALVYWTSQGVCFADNWSVRRRTAQAFQQGPCGYALGGRRIREGEAMLLQFQEQFQDLLNGANGFSTVTPAKLKAQAYFAWLPPAGLLPVAETTGQEGIQLTTFFAGMKVRELSEDPLFIEGAGLNGLLREALVYPPVDPNGQELTWVYHVRENEQPVAPGATAPPRYLAFTNGHIPYRGEARFDLSYWNLANTATGPAIQIRWFIGLGSGGTQGNQVSIEQEVVDDFNASQAAIHLDMEVVPNESARDTLLTEIAAGTGPDIVGPVGWWSSNALYGQWLDIAPYLQSTDYNCSKFEPALLRMYQTDQGTVGLPFVVFPSVILYNRTLFDEAGLPYPPVEYSHWYTMSDGNMADWTWDTLAWVARTLTVDASGHNATEKGFDKTSICQYGFSFGWEGHPNYWGAFWKAGSLLEPGGSKGSYRARIPDAWKAAWRWVYDGIWGKEPFIPSGAVAGSADFGSSNVFASGKVAMLANPSWYLSSLSDLIKAGGRFDFGAMPTYNGKTGGRVDADTFRIWKGTKHPAEAFKVLAYLIDRGINKLVLSSPKGKFVYDGIPGPICLRGPWLAAQKASLASVENWDTLLSGLNYPDVPNAESGTPNFDEAWRRIQAFGDLLLNEKGLDLNSQENKLEDELTVIFNK